MRFRPFSEAREYVHKLGLKNQSEWSEYSKSGKKPIYIPSDPRKPYKDKWKGWGDWLGTGYVANFEREHLPFEDAKKIVHSFGLGSKEDWGHVLKAAKSQ